MGDTKNKAAQAHIRYAKKHLKRIPLDVQKEEYEKIKAAADRVQESINGYIKESVRRRIESES